MRMRNATRTRASIIISMLSITTTCVFVCNCRTRCGTRPHVCTSGWVACTYSNTHDTSLHARACVCFIFDWKPQETRFSCTTSIKNKNKCVVIVVLSKYSVIVIVVVIVISVVAMIIALLVFFLPHRQQRLRFSPCFIIFPFSLSFCFVYIAALRWSISFFTDTVRMYNALHIQVQHFVCRSTKFTQVLHFSFAYVLYTRAV